MTSGRFKPLLPILKITNPSEFSSGTTYRCPNCDSHVFPLYINSKKIDLKYCEICGQAIDWENQHNSKTELVL